MIEIVYKEDKKGGGLEPKLNLPKNIRQIGEVEESRKIYIEDYVVTYLRRFAKERQWNKSVAILLGNFERMEGVPYFFIRGAIALKELELTGEGIPFTDEVWSRIYETIKEYFAEQDILGWFLSMPGYPWESEETLLKTHMKYFGGVDKVLMMGESIEGEEDFLAYENGMLRRQRGYHIFYERNEAMQRYMVDTGDGESVDEKELFEDRAIKNFRTIVQEKKELSGQKRIMTFLYAASTFLVMVVLVIGITLINNYEKMEGLEMTLSEISQSLEKQEEQIQQEEVLGTEVQEILTNSGEKAAEEEAGTEKQEEQTEETFQPNAGKIPESYIVQKGDTLLGISKKIYGNGEKMEAICVLNGIENSDHILAGQKLLLP